MTHDAVDAVGGPTRYNLIRKYMYAVEAGLVGSV